MHCYPATIIGCALAATLVYISDERLAMLCAAPLVVSATTLALCILPVLWERVRL
jgi:hypothetical protein